MLFVVLDRCGVLLFVAVLCVGVCVLFVVCRLLFLCDV